MANRSMSRPLRALTLAVLLPYTALASSGKDPAEVEQSAPFSFAGEPSTRVDLMRVVDFGPRIYVQARLPDGSTPLFLVDTGADVSAITEETAERIGLLQDGQVEVSGLSGTAEVWVGTIPQIHIGDATIPGVEVVVGVPGIGDRAFGMPVAGLLGNNVWGRFMMEIDYPKDRLTLSAPGSVSMPKNSTPLLFRQGHIFAPMGIQAAEKHAKPEYFEVHLDTGAGDLTLCGTAFEPISGAYTQGVEAIFGIGASETLPAYNFLRVTRRIPLARVHYGGKRQRYETSARWVDWDAANTPSCTSDMRGLAGHELMSHYRVLLDYQGQQVALLKSHGKPRPLNGHQVVLDQDLRENGTADVSRYFDRAHLYLGLNELDEATEQLRAFIAATPIIPDAGEDDPGASARVMLARVLRARGDLKGADEALSEMDPGSLTDQDELLAAVNTRLLVGDQAGALALASEAVIQRPDSGWALVAFADVMVDSQSWDAADAALVGAASKEDYPDAHLVRRARVALGRGDREAAMEALHHLLEVYPMMGQFYWFYAELLQTDEERALFQEDLDRALARLHPEDRPLDFQVASYRLLGDEERAESLMKEGLSRDCAQMKRGSSRDNCRAWYWSLAGQHQDKALRLIVNALTKEGQRSDFLDTKAMVHVSRGELLAARDAAMAAARLSPDDVYMRWQAERLTAAAAAQELP